MMAAGPGQAAALDCKQRRAVDRQPGAELIGGQPGMGVDMAAGAAGVMEAGEATRGRGGEDGLYLCDPGMA